MARSPRSGAPLLNPPARGPVPGRQEAGLPPLVVVGGSAGALQALRALVAGLPADFAASVLVVLHTSPDVRSRLPELLRGDGPLPASHALHGERPLPGHIHLAPPDNHLTLRGGRMRVVRGPKENGHRPAVDPLFRSAAREGGSRVWGVVLSGTLNCGAEGLSLIKACGGTTLVQDPHDALHVEMPASSIAQVGPHHVLAARDMGPLLAQLVRRAPAPPGGEEGREAIAEGNAPAELLPLDPSSPTCPECHGAMREFHSGGALRFHCHGGHQFSLCALATEQSDALEAALWAAVRSLHECEVTARRMAQRARPGLSARFEEKARGLCQHAGLLEEMLRKGERLRPLGEDREQGALPDEA